jgi:hypothetical protein
VQEAEASRRRVVPRPNVFARGFEQNEGADDVGFDEGRRVVNRTIHVRFRREVHDAVRLMIAKQRLHRFAVGDVGLHEPDARIAQRLRQIRRVSRISQLVENDEPRTGLRQRTAHEVRADESGAPRNDECVHQITFRVKNRWNRVGAY